MKTALDYDRWATPVKGIIACCPWLPLLRGGLCKSTEYS